MPAVIQTAIRSQGMEVTMTVTVTREAQTSTNFVGRRPQRQAEEELERRV